MGLRERKATRTRELVLDVALALFLERGYEATTMEEIADRAEIGTSTLYRYFPQKEALLLEPLGLRGQLSGALAARPADESLDVALGHAVQALVLAPRTDQARQSQIYAVVNSNPGPRARLYEMFTEERTQLEKVITDRLGRPSGDLYCRVTARTTTMLIELISELNSDIDTDASPEVIARRSFELARQVTDLVRSNPPAIPRMGS